MSTATATVTQYGDGHNDVTPHRRSGIIVSQTPDMALTFQTPVGLAAARVWMRKKARKKTNE